MQEQKKLLDHVIQDFLEIKSGLKHKELFYLIRALRKRDYEDDCITPHASFSVGKRMVIIHDSEATECWVYNPRKKKIWTTPFDC